ncbi:hypothetical protein EV292_106197 [Sphingomonas sp. BK235]|nr:hypothetical protein EV292_106197 [Sphingomonas sp. BK235]
MTTAPADSLDEAALRRMAGESVETCLQWFEALSTELLVDLLLTYRHFAAGYPDVIAEIDEGLATLERSIVRLDSQFFRDPTISSN